MRTIDLNSLAPSGLRRVRVAVGRADAALGRFARWWSGAAAALAFTLVVGGCSAGSPEELIASAKLQLAKNDQQTAVVQLKQALEQAPDSAEARFLLGEALLGSGDAVGAALELGRARSLGYADDAVVPLLAQAMVEQGQLNAVIGELATVHLSTAKAQADLQVALAAAYAGQKMQEAADDAIRAALTAQPNHSGALALKAQFLAGRGDFDAALKTLDTALESNPKDDRAWTLKGTVLVASHADPDAALDAYRKAIAINIRNFDAHDGALTILVGRKDPAQVQAQLDVLAKAFPKHRLTRYFQAYLAYLQHDYAAASRLAQPLAAAAPGDVRVQLLAGAVEFQLGALLQAEAYLGKAVQLNPTLALPRRLLVMAYLRHARADKALAAAEPALSVPNADPDLVRLAAEAYLVSGDATKADELYARAAKLDPQAMGSRTAAAMSEVTRGDPVGGFRQLEALAAEDKGFTADLALFSAHLRRQEFAPALRAIDGLEKKQPGKPLPHFLRAQVQMAMNKPDQARKSFEQALAADPLFVPAAASLAALDMADGKGDAARQRFDSVLAKDPKNVPSLLGLADVTARTGGGKDEVTRLLRQAVEADPQQAGPRLLLVEYLVREKDLPAALAAAQAGVAALPASAQLLDALGRVQLRSGDANQALSNFTKAATLQPKSASAQLRLADAYLASGDAAAARQALGRALALQPDLLPAQQQLIALEMAANRPQQALAIARTVQQQRPKQTIGFVIEGEIQLRQRDFGASEHAFRTALAREPGNGDVAASLNEALTWAEKKAEADRFAASWVKEHPKDVLFLARAGSTALARQDYARAEDLLRNALAISPDNAIVLNNLAWVVAHQGKPGAVAYAEKANAKAPDQPMFMDTLAYALAMDGQFDQAIELQKKVMSLQPQAAPYRLNLAKIYIKAGRKSDAEAELNELAKLGDKFGAQADVTELLKSLKSG